MLISIQETYRGHKYRYTLEPGEHEVPDHVGEYLVSYMSGPPFFAKEVKRKPAIETKPAYPVETKPKTPSQTKRTSSRTTTTKKPTKPRTEK